MKMLQIKIWRVILLCTLALTAPASSIERPEYEILPIGSVKPQGWLLKMLECDLREGLTGNYDQICSTVSLDVFAKQNRVPGVKIKGSRGQMDKEWWAGEHEGYRMDGLVRTVILTGSENEQYLQRITTWIENILAGFDRTGYIGIYSPETRFPSKGWDGELWTQSRAMQALLAWYEFSGDTRVLNAVSETVHKTIDSYRRQGSYFLRPGAEGGVYHGVGYMDTLEWLWRLTGDDWFADAAVWLYEDYGKCDKDLQCKNMLDAQKLWKDHTPHTAESLHMPGIAAWFSGKQEYKKASNNVLLKLARHTNPGGSFIAGDLEVIGEVIGDGDGRGEYCAMVESIFTLNRLFQYDDNVDAGHWIERCALNAAQGARFHPANTAVIYLSSDNRLTADDYKINGAREIYSASHGAAACCTLNSTRLLPAYIEGMWFKNTRKPGLFANLYGASVLETKLNGSQIKIVQETDYPFKDRVIFHFHSDKSNKFQLALRIPPNSGKINVDTDAEVHRDGNVLRIDKTWSSGDRVVIDFDFQIKRCLQHDEKESFYTWGPLVFALPIEPEISKWREIEKGGEKTGAYDLLIKPITSYGWDFTDNPNASFHRVDLPGDLNTPWRKPVIGLRGSLYNQRGEQVEFTLVPLGSTILRRTTFPLKSQDTDEVKGQNQGKTFSEEDEPMRDF